MKEKREMPTLEEKEILRRLMETPGVERDWDFFGDISMEAPPPEFFMRGQPEQLRTHKLFAVAAGISAFRATLHEKLRHVTGKLRR